MEKQQVNEMVETFSKAHTEILADIIKVIKESTDFKTLVEIVNKNRLAYSIHENHKGITVKHGDVVTVIEGKQKQYRKAILIELKLQLASAQQALDMLKTM